jgi:glutamate-ammonia-ligase adenylyltransferase
MEIDQLRRYLDEPAEAGTWLSTLQLSPQASSHANLRRMAEAGVTLDLLGVLCEQFHAVASQLADPDMAWNNLERFVGASRNPMATVALFERDPHALPNLVQIFSTSQYLSDLLVCDNECYDLLRMTEGQPVARDLLVDEIVGEVSVMHDASDVLAALRRYKQRETMRIAYGDIVRNLNVAHVARQISFLADAIVEAALRYSRNELEEKWGVPTTPDGERAKFVVLALGKLGGIELNYSSDIDLILMYDEDGQTTGRRNASNQEFFERLARDMVRLLTETTDLGAAYRVDLRLRPEGSRGPMCLAYDQMVHYYDTKGRTWERQAFVKARPIAGDLALGDRLLERLEPWIYRRYLSLADITGIKSLKRRIEGRAAIEEGDQRNVKTGHGGIRDIEFVIQFLQLLNGGTLPEVRTGNTFDAIKKLETAGCLTPQEAAILEDNYSMLRKVEHRLQIMFDLQTHLLPSDPEEIQRLAIRMGYGTTPHQSARAAFESDYKHRTELNRRMLDHLLHDAFGTDAAAEPEVDLVNDPDPSPERIEQVLGRYPFTDIEAAYENLMSLATERIRLLSTRRCRHFLASIAPRLLAAIAQTPDPDTTLVNLTRVSDSLGGKAALWELFSANRPSLELYVKLCAACPYLASILTSNPGMIDELMDSLLVERLATLDELEQALGELLRGAEDAEPILHSFKNAQHLRVGVRDIVGKDDIRETHAALSDIAEVCLKHIIRNEYAQLADKYGEPTITELGEGDDVDPAYRERFAGRAGERCELIVLAMGKLGGREPNYHSDLDLVFLYEAEGQTVHHKRHHNGGTSNGHFFSELGQRIIKLIGRAGPFGRLYEVDVRLRPTGRSGLLAMPVEMFRRYFAEGQGQLWERQALCKARVIYGGPAATEYALQAVAAAAFGPPWRPEQAQEIRNMRLRLEDTASPRNLKRGRGGTVDTEFLVQLLQLKHGGNDPNIRVTGTLDAISALETAGYLSKDDAEYFRQSYRFQRSVEARIRLMNAAGRHEFPDDPKELEKLAYLLGVEPKALEERAMRTFAENRERFERVFGAASG